ncbi:MAG: futalosine hydrolase [Chitinophagaceae bacterium]|nr:futalosine hydrolase [Chitinophagaceae bacterium]
MRILLISATRMELAPVIDWLKERDNQVGDHLIIPGITGVGSLLTGWWLGRHMAEINPQLVIQAGVAGSFSAAWEPTQPLAVERDTIGDLGAWEASGFKSVFDLHLIHPDLPPFHQSWLINPHQQLLQQTGLPLVASATVNQVTTREEDIHRLRSAGVKLETMEGAAGHYACLQAGIPFLQIRTVSNAVGVRDKQEWQMATAVRALNDYLINWLPALKTNQL